MKKRKKPTKKQQDQALTVAADKQSTQSERAQAAASKGQARMELMADAAWQRVGAEGGEYDDKAASHFAWLTTQQTQAMGEFRKQEAHDMRAARDMDPAERDELVKQYVASLPVERRREFRVLLDDLDKEESVLA